MDVKTREALGRARSAHADYMDSPAENSEGALLVASSAAAEVLRACLDDHEIVQEMCAIIGKEIIVSVGATECNHSETDVEGCVTNFVLRNHVKLERVEESVATMAAFSLEPCSNYGCRYHNGYVADKPSIDLLPDGQKVVYAPVSTD